MKKKNNALNTGKRKNDRENYTNNHMNTDSFLLNNSGDNLMDKNKNCKLFSNTLENDETYSCDTQNVPDDVLKNNEYKRKKMCTVSEAKIIKDTNDFVDMMYTLVERNNTFDNNSDLKKDQMDNKKEQEDVEKDVKENEKNDIKEYDEHKDVHVDVEEGLKKTTRNHLININNCDTYNHENNNNQNYLIHNSTNNTKTKNKSCIDNIDLTLNNINCEIPLIEDNYLYDKDKIMNDINTYENIEDINGKHHNSCNFMNVDYKKDKHVTSYNDNLKNNEEDIFFNNSNKNNFVLHNNNSNKIKNDENYFAYKDKLLKYMNTCKYTNDEEKHIFLQFLKIKTEWVLVELNNLEEKYHHYFRNKIESFYKNYLLKVKNNKKQNENIKELEIIFENKLNTPWMCMIFPYYFISYFNYKIFCILKCTKKKRVRKNTNLIKDKILTSKLKGVNFIKYKKAWCFTYVDVDDKKKKKIFPVNDYGFVESKALSILLLLLLLL